MSDSPIKRKRERRCIQLLYAEELPKEQLPESFDRKLDTIENGRNNEADHTKKILNKAEEKEEQNIHRQVDSKRKAAMFFPLKVVKEVIVIESGND